jgi:hypothetical protein
MMSLEKSNNNLISFEVKSVSYTTKNLCLRQELRDLLPTEVGVGLDK